MTLVITDLIDLYEAAEQAASQEIDAILKELSL